tara:strand:- start:874 stop:2475 length:1602 start_codon:yes stop_codon:yes gene_type:complete
MCGIFAYFSQNNLSAEDIKCLKMAAGKSQHRGPDNTQYKISETALLCFHRLKINDMSNDGNQPMSLVHDDITLICNGEIYNYKELIKENEFQMNSMSDCEVILHMYKKYGIHTTIASLDGVFAFVIVDNITNKVFVGRDPFGVRSLYIGRDEKGISVASELKSLHDISTNVSCFPPGQYVELTSNATTRYYNYTWPQHEDADDVHIMEKINLLLREATKKRTLSDRPVGCLLSGGLDSSLITALVAEHYPKGSLKTFSIGLEGSADLKYAKIVADFIGTDHHEVIISESDMLAALEEDIQQIESYDTTTVRASTPMYLLSKYIKEHTDVAVIFSGEGSDEASGSYMYFHNAPSGREFKAESERLMEDLHYFDVLRCDKSTAGAGLEVRVPFLDKSFLEYYMAINPNKKMPKAYNIEKYLLRKAFEHDNILPNEVLWRIKEGMSDGVSGKKRAWFQVIQAHVDGILSDDEFTHQQASYEHAPPNIKESLYYRQIFDTYYPGRAQLMPYYWLPKWSGDVLEPSARVLNCYSNTDS